MLEQLSWRFCRPAAHFCARTRSLRCCPVQLPLSTEDWLVAFPRTLGSLTPSSSCGPSARNLPYRNMRTQESPRTAITSVSFSMMDVHLISRMSSVTTTGMRKKNKEQTTPRLSPATALLQHQDGKKIHSSRFESQTTVFDERSEQSRFAGKNAWPRRRHLDQMRS